MVVKSCQKSWPAYASWLTILTLMVASGAAPALAKPAAPSFATVAGLMRSGRIRYALAVLPSGKVLIVGGLGIVGGNGTELSSAEVYDPATGTFSPTAPMMTARDDPTGTLLPNGLVLITGGRDVSANPQATAELYNP